jgi:hypothetical protein
MRAGAAPVVDLGPNRDAAPSRRARGFTGLATRESRPRGQVELFVAGSRGRVPSGSPSRAHVTFGSGARRAGAAPSSFSGAHDARRAAGRPSHAVACLRRGCFSSSARLAELAAVVAPPTRKMRARRRGRVGARAVGIEEFGRYADPTLRASVAFAIRGAGAPPASRHARLSPASPRPSRPPHGSSQIPRRDSSRSSRGRASRSAGHSAIPLLNILRNEPVDG